MTENTDRTVMDCHVYSLGSDEDPSLSVLTAVAAVMDQSPAELPVLSDTVNPDGLNRLFDTTDENASSLTVTFEYSGCQVTVTSDRIKVERL